MSRPFGRVNFDITGQRFGRYMALHRDGSTKAGSPLWRCRCDCGTEKLVQSIQLRNSTVVSCGCFQKERCVEVHTKHGKSDTKTYRAWGNMIQRCTNPNNHHYEAYGGRGIQVCAEWFTFSAFLKDMGLCPPNLSLDRINNDGHYLKANCRWATEEQQKGNKQKTRKRRQK